MHLFFYVCLLAFLLFNVLNEITDGNQLNKKQGIFFEEQGPQVLRWKETTDHESLRTTALEQSMRRN